MTPNRIRVPFVDLPPNGGMVTANKSDTYRHLISEALKRELPPLVVDLKSPKTGTIYLPPTLMAKVELVATNHGMLFPAAFAGLCAAAIKVLETDRRKRISGEKAFLEEWDNTGILKDPRPEQARFFQGLILGLRDSKIVVAEASTGVGKGRAMMAAAVEVVRQGKKPAIVAAPTIAVMSQLHTEYQKLGASGINLAIRPGRSEFVDDQKLRDYLEDAELIDKKPSGNLEGIKAWVKKGAPALDAKNALAVAMKNMGVRAAWLLDDLQAIGGDFPADMFRLNLDSEKCASLELLNEYCDNLSEDADIILCTHAMLALGQKTQWNKRVLPQPSVLFVDEAHQFEQTMAQFNSSEISLYSLRWRLLRLQRVKALKTSGVVGKALKVVKAIIGDCRSMDTQDNQVIRLDLPDYANTDEVRAYAKIMGQLEALKGLLASRTLSDMPGIKDDREALNAVSRATTGSDRVNLFFSPTRHYPSVLAGACRLDGPMRHLWKSAEGGVVLASATLFIPENGVMKCDYIRDVLSIPLERIYPMAPIESAHIYTLPTLYYPSLAKREKLCAPSHKKGASRDAAQFAEDESRWLNAAAEEITAGPLRDAAGGTLVLCTSYVQIEILVQQLVTRGIAPERIVAQERGKKFSQIKEKYTAIHSQGIRPVMLALGMAWTGLDLADKTIEDDAHAAQDTLLTDLVILRAPVGLNRSNTMLDRTERMGLYPIAKEALLIFKQGLGRLIRRQNVTNRRIWVMDGRLWRDWKGMEAFSASARELLSKYKRTKDF